MKTFSKASIQERPSIENWSFYKKTILTQAREVLMAEYGKLVLKKHRLSLSKKEGKRLVFIRQQLDRMYNVTDEFERIYKLSV